TTSVGIPLREYVKSPVYRGIVSGLTEAFVIDDATRIALTKHDPKSAQLIKPFMMGKDIRRWSIKDGGRWLIYIPHGADLRDFDDILQHWRSFETQLEAR